MVRYILICSFLFSLSAHADFLGFKTDAERQSKIPKLVEKLKSLEMEDGPVYEDNFNQSVKLIENAVEEEKLFCAGETADGNGKVISKDKKQVCFRDLKTTYLEAMDGIFNLKLKYFELIHKRQTAKLQDIQQKLKADVEKSF